ncbi:hypothetical protein KIL84_012287 [Mauremys mutica]|uniref:Reverse transcriptase domain-containing protein n=1 Tax=Mauremys mutica TaxID=74926 RepID=A0A9D3XG91_9SAUR|nr:hypothetical protein KIL84_012287 [Mauremys mutica]
MVAWCAALGVPSDGVFATQVMNQLVLPVMGGGMTDEIIIMNGLDSGLRNYFVHVVAADKLLIPMVIGIRYWTNGKLFNLRRLQANTKVQEITVCDLLFADGCFLNAKSESNRQESMDYFSSACDNFGLTINTNKREVMYQPTPGKPYVEPTITVTGQTLQAVDKFTYLSSTLSHAVHIDDETNTRFAKASVAFSRICVNEWEHRAICQQTKLKVYKNIMLPILTVYRCHVMKLHHFHMVYLRKLMRIRWQDKVPDIGILIQAGIPSIHTLLTTDCQRRSFMVS